MVREQAKAKSKVKSVPAEPGIVVTAQQSRFHVDASDTPASKEIDVKDLTLTVTGRELLVDAHLRLQDGMHYVLVGRNGTGKSTLLKAIAEERVPGIAANLQCLLLGQTLLESTGEVNADSTAKITTLERVIKSDAKRGRILRQSQALSHALESTNALDAVRAHRALEHERSQYTLKRAQLIAARRSGVRGWDARAALNRIETALEASQEVLDQRDTDITPEAIEQETKEAAQSLDDLQSYLDVSESGVADIRAKEILKGLRFSEDQINAPFTSLSGGWRMRCELASSLFQRPDVLLLDEPTNFLDLPAVIWLQNYVKDCACTVVVVTHDRDFADTVAEELVVLRNQKLEAFDGNLSLYEKERHAKIKQMTKMKEAQDKKTSHMEKTIENSLAAAKRTGDDKKLKQAASRKKKLEDRTGMEVSAKGTRFKLNRDLAGFHLTSREEIDIPQDDPLVKMTFPNEPPDLRHPGALLTLENVSFRYSRAKDATLQKVSLTIHLGDRIGLVGANGTGKSTVVKLAVADMEDSIVATSGSISRHPRLRVGYFSQHAIEELEQLKAQDTKDGRSLTALAHLMDVAGSELPEPKARALLGGMGLPGRIASDVPISALSGGQRVRLALAKIMWSPPQLLVLDEMTTHLDADTIIALIGALKKFEGAILLVTHDRFFMRCVVEGDRINKPSGGDEGDDDYSDSDDDENESRRRVVYRMVKGSPKELPGGMAQYEEIASRAAIKQTM